MFQKMCRNNLLSRVVLFLMLALASIAAHSSEFAAGSPYLTSSGGGDFGDVTVGSSKTLQLTLTNSGSASDTVTAITNSNSAAFSMSQTCTQGGGVLPAGSSCTITLTFKPSAVGAQSTNIGVSSAVTRVYIVIPVKGSGVSPAPSLSLSSARVDFGTVTINTQSTTQDVTIKNAGGSPISFKSISQSGDFVGVTNCTSGGVGTLAAGGSCTVKVLFKPSAEGTRTGSITFNTDDVVSPTYSIVLAGIGAAPSPSLSMSSTRLDFGQVTVSTQSAAQTVTIKNVGGSPVSFTKPFTTTGDYVSKTSCLSGSSGTLAAGASCTLTVTFNPSVEGARSGSIAVATDDAVSPNYSIVLAGTGTNVAPNPSCTPSTLQGSAVVSGPITLQMIDMSMSAACGDKGKSGNVFISANVPGAGMFYMDAQGRWLSSRSCADAVAYQSNALGTISRVALLAAATDLTSLRGTSLYVGYGSDATTDTACRNMQSNGTSKLVHTIGDAPQPPAPSSNFDSRLVGTWDIYHYESKLYCFLYCTYINNFIKFATLTIQSDGSFRFSDGSGFDNGKLAPYNGASSGQWGEIGGLGGSKYYLYYDATQDKPLQIKKVDGNGWDDVTGVLR